MNKDQVSLWAQVKNWLVLALVGLGILAAIGLIVFVVSLGYAVPATGFGQVGRPVTPEQEFVRGKTLWDWLQLLFIPITLLVAGALFNYTEQRRHRENEQRAAQRELNRSAALKRREELASEQQMQESALQTYMEQVTYLMVEKGLGFDPRPGVSQAARGWTTIIARRLNGERKAVLLRFLQEASLIFVGSPHISLEEVDLRDARMSSADLRGTDLRRADLRGAHLVNARFTSMPPSPVLTGSLRSLLREDVSAIHLPEITVDHLRPLLKPGLDDDALETIVRNLTRAADLSGAKLQGADLRYAEMQSVNLCKADLSPLLPTVGDIKDALLTAAVSSPLLNILDVHDLQMKSKAIPTNLSSVDLRGADLTMCTLNSANLQWADLTGAIVELADFSGANLCGTKLEWQSKHKHVELNPRVKNAYFDRHTTWPEGYDPVANGAVCVEDAQS